MDEVVARVLAAYGGEKIDRVHAYRMEVTVQAKVRRT